ncbi:MAG TPA: thermopsin family protease [Thermoplasmata archaeon]|nr:thermopsin family protease [Thermoplasmata archaeon]
MATGEADRAAQTVASIESAGVPLRYAFLPDLDRQASPAAPGAVVSPSYPDAPAPIGVADFGVQNRSGTLVADNLSTSRVEGTFAPTQFTGLSMDVAAPDIYGVQLNAVLQDVTLFGDSSYSFWTQNVAEYSTYSHELLLLDNLWNFSSSAAALSSNAIFSHGPNGTQVGSTYYYALGPEIEVGYPFQLTLFLNSSVLDNRDVVFFNYTVSSASVSRAGSYDELVFSSTPSPTGGPTPAPAYVANGYLPNALGLPDDIELAIGGPGGGSNFDAFNTSAAMDLYYWDAGSGTFRVVPSAYDVGGDTGETSSGLASTWTALGDSALNGPPGPAAHLSQGPALLGGEWNVTNGTAGATVLNLRLAPENGFLFLGPGASPTDSAFQWVPPVGPYTVSPGTYSLAALASHYAPETTTVVVAGSSTWLNVSLASDPMAGVYTPLWALSTADLSNISSSCGSGTCTLWDDESGPLGVPADGTTNYPWFGTFNDFFYPELPGVLLWNVTGARILSPPSLEVTTPPWLLNFSSRFGTPSDNDLPIFLYDDSSLDLAGAASIGGWWFEGSYLGPAAAQASVVLWNTSESVVANNTFLTSAVGLFLYGGTNNTVDGNTFLSYLPLAPNEASLSGAVYGTTGLYEADYGNGGVRGTGCGCFDLVYNNAFGTYFTAVEPKLDPYTGALPRLPFDARWNVTAAAGPNIAGGSELGGNYWWDYGTSDNPYWVLPYTAGGAIYAGGDERPLLPDPLWTVTFDEKGLPAGTAWRVGVETSTGTAYRSSTGTSLAESWPAGEYFLEAGSLDGSWGIPTTQLLVVNAANETVVVQFYPLYSLAFSSVGLPSDGFWTVTIWNPFGSWIDLGNVPTFPAQSLVSSTWNFTISPPPGYAADPATGTIDLVQNTTVVIDFSSTTSLGALVGSIRPGLGATLEVDQHSVGVAAGGTFSVNLPPGLHSVEVTETGYAPYFNNVSVTGGGTTELTIVLTPAGSGSGSPSTAVLEVLLVVVSAVAVGLGAAALALYRRGRRPPPPPPLPPPGV